MTEALDLTTGPWVTVVYMDGDDYETAMDETNNMGGSTGAAVEYLAQWDNGADSDAAETRDSAPWGAYDTTHVESFGGLTYVYATNHIVGYVSLQRRPLTYP